MSSPSNYCTLWANLHGLVHVHSLASSSRSLEPLLSFPSLFPLVCSLETFDIVGTAPKLLQRPHNITPLALPTIPLLPVRRSSRIRQRTSWMDHRDTGPLDDGDLALRAADALLAEEEGGQASRDDGIAGGQHSRRTSLASAYGAAGHAGPHVAGGKVLASWAALVVLSAWTSRLEATQLARHSRTVAAWFPLTHFSVLGAVLAVYPLLRGQSLARGGGGLELGGGAGLARDRRVGMAAGAAVALSLMLRVWEVRVGQERLCEAIEVRPFLAVFCRCDQLSLLQVFVIPAVLAFSPYITSIVSPAHSPATASSALVMMAAASTFLIGFALIGVPASGVAAALALVRIPLDAVGLLFLKEGLGAENPALFLRDAVSVRSLSRAVICAS